ncbi:MAG: NYN domain-containing protein [Dehalococcoidia bacterium]|nr:NYN domain-containing protein [Dehalococcoidia bacterium]
MNGPIHSGDDVALFIDWENFKISLAVGHRTPNVSALKEEVSNHGRVVVAKAYADWVTRAPELRGASQFINDPPALYAAGIEPVYVPTRLALGSNSTRTTRVKNSVDVKMTADCIEIAHSYPNIGTYVLVSGDSDFIHVINALRTMGKRVIIIGVSWATSRRFADTVDALILYDQDIDTVVPDEPAAASDARTPPEPAAASGGRGPARSSTPAGKQDLAAIISAIEDIIRTERQAGGTPLLTSIKQRLLRRYPDFDEKKVGFSGFKKLMSRVAQEGNIRLITVGLVDWAIMADEETPSDAKGAPSDSAQSAEDDAQDEPPTEVKRSRFSFGRRRTPERQETAAEAPEEPPENESTEQPAESPTMTAGSVDDEPDDAPQDVPEDGSPESIGEFVSDDAVAVPQTTQVNGLAAILAETLPQLNLPPSQPDGLDGRRVADIIIMADTLEHQEAVSHVAFNFLVSEVCQALDEGLKAEHLEITQRWGQDFSRTYVTKMVRSLGNADLFTKGWHTATDSESGRSRRLRTFYLNRTHPLVEKVLQDRWAPQESQDEPVAVESVSNAEPAELSEYGDSSGTTGPSTYEETADSTEPSFLSRFFRSNR